MAFIYMIPNQKTLLIFFFKKSISIIKSIFAEEFFFLQIYQNIENSFLRLKKKTQQDF